MVACQDYTTGPADRYPAGSFKGLGCLVDEKGAKFHAVEQTVGRAYQGTGYDACLTKEFGIDAYLQFGGTTLQAIHLLVPVVCTFSMTAQFTDSLADSP